MADKRADYFVAGTKVVWDVDPVAECIHVYKSPAPTQPTTYRRGATPRKRSRRSLAGASPSIGSSVERTRRGQSGHFLRNKWPDWTRIANLYYSMAYGAPILQSGQL